MAWSYIPSTAANGGNSGTGATPVTATLGAAVAVGDRIIVVISCWQTTVNPSITSVTDGTNTYSPDLVVGPFTDDPGFPQIVAVYSAPVVGAGTPTISVAGSFEGCGIAVAAYSGLSTTVGSGAIDKTASAHGNSMGAVLSSGATAATTAANELVIGAYGDDAWNSLPSGYSGTSRTYRRSGADADVGLADEDSGISGTTPATTTTTTVQSSYAQLAVVYKLAGAGGGSPPFTPTDFPNPRHRHQLNSGFVARMAATLVGQDRLVGGPGQPLANYHWPVPPPRAYPKGLAGDTSGMPLAIRLSIVPSALPPGQPEFTRPSRRVVAPDLLTFINYYVIDDSAPFAQSDWPTPPPTLYPIALRTYVQPSNRALLRDVAFGGDGKPFAPIPDAEVPQWKRYPVDLRTWAQSLVLSTLSLPTPPPFSQQDWPNPPFAKFARDPRGLVHALSLVLRDAGFGAAGQTKTYDWPVPPFTPLPVGLRTWINTVRLHLIGRDTFFGAAGQTKTYDWPLPQRRRHPIIPVEPWPLFLAVAVPVTPPIPPAAEVAPLGVRTGPIVDGASPRHGPITEAAGRRRW